MKKSDFKGIYAEMSEILGEEIVKIIHKHYKGQQVNFPMKLYSNEYVENYIIENYSEKTVREISRTLGYSDKWVQKLIKLTELGRINMKEIILNSALTISLIIGAIAGFKIFKWLRSHFVFIGTPLGFITAFVACSMFPAMLVYGVLGGTINEVDKTVSNITKPKYEKYIDDAEQAETTEEKIKYLKKSLDEEYNTKALQEITYIITTKIQFNEEYEVYYNMVKDSFKSKDLNILHIEMYKRFADNELYNKNYDKAMEYLKKAENLGMNIGDSHVFWEIKEIKDNERKYNSEPNKDLENKREEYLNKFSEINNEVSEFNYSGTDTQIKDTYSLVLKKWDNALNEIYNDLKNILSSTDMELLRIAQKDWVIRRDKRAEEDSKMYGSNSTEEIEYTKSLADSTKERYYELIENYLN